MEISVLGPLEVRRSGVVIVIGAPKLRALLSALALEVGHAVPAERLIDGLWGAEPPPQPLVSLRSYVSNLRRLLREPGDRPVISTRAGGYALDLDEQRIDARRFERLAREGRDALVAGDPAASLALTTEATSLWRGEAYADIADDPSIRPVAAKLDELRLTATEDRFEALIALGRHVDVVPELEAHVARHALRERPHRQLMLALYRSGRVPDALQVGADHRAALVDEFGLDPSPRLGELTDRILRQDPSLDAPVTPAWSEDAATRSAFRPSGAAVAARAGGAPGTAAASTASEPTGSGIVGREHELRRLTQALDRLSDGEGGVVLIAGEPGIGKTALLRELVQLAEGPATAWGRCLDQDGAPPFWPWIEALRALAEDLDDDALRAAMRDTAAPVTQLVPELADRAGIARATVGGDADSARFALYDAITTFLARIARPRGLVLAIDDLHWADPSTLQLVEFLAPRALAARVLLSITHRVAPTDRTSELDRTLASIARASSVTMLEPGALDRDEVSTVLAGVTGAAPDARLVDEVSRRAAGNPFFVRQLGALLTESPTRADDRATIPRGVRHVILQRVQQLPAEVRATLDLAAILGQRFDVRTAAAAASCEVLTILDHVDVAIQHGLLEVGEENASAYRFVHALVRETLEDELAPGRAIRLHAAIADALAATDPPPVDALAEHLWQAADLVTADRVVAALRAAADDALDVLAYERAEQHLRRALYVLAHAGQDDPATELAVRLRLVQILTSLEGWSGSAREEVSGRVRELAGRAGTGADVVPLWWSLWSTAMTRGDPAAARDLSDELLGHAERAEEPAGLVAGHVAVAYTRLFHGEDITSVLERLEHARRAEEASEPASLSRTPEHLGVSRRVNVAMAHALAGDVATTLAAASELVAYGGQVANPFQEAYACMFAAWAAACVDRPEDALAFGDAGIAASQGARFAYLLHLLTPVHGWAAARCGAAPEPELARMLEAIGALQTAGQSHALANWNVFLAEVHLLAGDEPSARTALDRADALVHATCERVYTPQIERVRAAFTR